MKRCRLLLPLVLVAFAAGSANAMSEDELASKLPRIWCATFTWPPNDKGLRFRVDFNRVYVLPGGRVQAVGSATYLPSRSHPKRSELTASIDAATLKVVLRTGGKDGHFEGILAPALDRITTILRGSVLSAWLVLDSGKKAGVNKRCGAT